MRIGLGEDSHRTTPGGPLRLGGIDVPHDRQLVGHSDADVLLHAITDALLGAAGLGDIGELFPNTDPQWHNADSAIFLREAQRRLTELDWKIVNLDCTIHAERPKLSPHKQTIAARIAELLGLDRNQVNIKAKTGEKVRRIGRQEAINADAVVLIEHD